MKFYGDYSKSGKTVKLKREWGKNAFGNQLGNSPGFQMQPEDLRLKYFVPEENSKNNIPGRTRCFPRKLPAPSDPCRFHLLLLGQGML